MKRNYEIGIVGSTCILVPYRPEHVEYYHEWMQDPHLLEATGSEPLTLKEEYEMQESWRDDEFKCTFIILERKAVDVIPEKEDNDFVARNVKAMVGDVNLFLSDEEEEDVGDENPQRQSTKTIDPADTRKQAELDIMVAEKEARGKGIGREAACLMMFYGAKALGIRRFFCKINEGNSASLALFRKLGFEQCDYAECFQQLELELKQLSSEAVIEKMLSILGCEDLRSFRCAASSTTGGWPSDRIEEANLLLSI